MKDNKTFQQWVVWTFFILVTLNKFVKCDHFNEFHNINKSSISNCSLVPEKDRMRLKLNKLIDDDNRMIKLRITVKWDEHPANESYPAQMLWYMTTDGTGQRLLLLHDNFTVMSLGLLSYGIADMQLVFLQNPENCLSSLTMKEADELLKFTLLTFPNTSTATNDDGISILHVCTGSVNANGSCCNISLSGDAVRCFELEEDIWLSRISIFISVLTLVFLMRLVYLIPSSVYDDDTSEIYTPLDVSDLKFYISLKIKHVSVNEGKDISNDWIKVPNLDAGDVLLKRFQDEAKKKLLYMCSNRQNGLENDIICNFLVQLNSVEIKHDRLVSESVSFLKLSQHLYKTFSDIFLDSKIKNADALRQTCHRTCCCCGMRWYSVLKYFIIAIIIMLSVLPFIIRVAFSFIYKDRPRGVVIFNIIIISVALILVLDFTICRNVGFLKKIKDSFITTLQKIHMGNAERRIETFILVLAPPNQEWKCNLCSLTAVALRVIKKMIKWFPMLQFPVIFLNSLLGEWPFCTKTMVPLFYLLTYWPLFIFIDCIIFYIQSLLFILIGVILNFQQVSDKIILTLIILVYAYDCLSYAYQKIERFNYKVIKVLYGMIDEFCTDHNGTPFDKVKREQESKMTRINMTPRENRKFINIEADAEGNARLITRGLFLYYKFQNPDNLPYMHVPERFLDELVSVRSQLTPGAKFTILYEACKEIISILIALVVVFLIISGFGRKNDLSAGVNTFVSIGSSVALMKLNKLMFQTNECTLNDHGLHLKALVERHVKSFKDLLINANFDVLDVSHDTPPSNNTQASFFTYNLRRSSFHSDEDCDIVVELCEEKAGSLSESWYIKRFFPENKPPSLSDFNLPNVYHEPRREYDIL